jgi:AbrB family looped-hinge helix DNA binding protein
MKYTRHMLRSHSKLTAQAQVSVPASVRQALGLSQGSVLEWIEQDGQIIVRRAARHDSMAVHEALFPQEGPAAPAPSPAALKDGIRARMRKRHARD